MNEEEIKQAQDNMTLDQAARIVADRELEGQDAITTFFTVVSSIVQAKENGVDDE